MNIGVPYRVCAGIGTHHPAKAPTVRTKFDRKVSEQQQTKKGLPHPHLTIFGIHFIIILKTSEMNGDDVKRQGKDEIIKTKICCCYSFSTNLVRPHRLFSDGSR